MDLIRAALGPGHGWRLVNHWASWCLPCIEEFPHRIALHGTFGGRLEFFGISWDMFDKRGDQEDIVEHIENYADGHGVVWPSLLVDEAVPAEDFFRALGLSYQKIPQTWIIDESGAVVERIDGVIDAAGVASLSARLEELLA